MSITVAVYETFLVSVGNFDEGKRRYIYLNTEGNKYGRPAQVFSFLFVVIVLVVLSSRLEKAVYGF